MKTDRELLELAAKAAGITAKRSRLDDPAWKDLLVAACRDGQETFVGWNPLTDDGDALRLAVKLGMCIGPNFDGDRVIADAGEFSTISMVEVFIDDKTAATRRAIVRAAAAIGESL